MRAVQFATAEASAEEAAASGSEPNAGALSRASTLDADLNELHALEVPWSNQPAGSTDLSKAATAASGERPAEGLVIHNWSLRPPAANDARPPLRRPPACGSIAAVTSVDSVRCSFPTGPGESSG